jgi:hypothetical protein
MHIILTSTFAHCVKFIRYRLKISHSHQPVIGNISKILDIEFVGEFMTEAVGVFMVSLQNVTCLTQMVEIKVKLFL